MLFVDRRDMLLICMFFSSDYRYLRKIPSIMTYILRIPMQSYIAAFNNMVRVNIKLELRYSKQVSNCN